MDDPPEVGALVDEPPVVGALVDDPAVVGAPVAEPLEVGAPVALSTVGDAVVGAEVEGGHMRMGNPGSLVSLL